MTAPETQLVEHVVDGKLLDFAGSEAVDEDAMRTWSDDRTIRAEVIREIMRGRLAPASEPTRAAPE